MSGWLLVLCVAAFGMVALVVSAAVGVALPALDRLATEMTPGRRARLWLGIAILPGAVATLAVLVSLLPAVGVGSDHCLAHDPHHPHLCPHHLGSAPGWVVVVVAVLMASRVVQLAGRAARAIGLSQVTSRALAEASEREGDVFVFPSDEPQAFVLGTLRPRVHVSSRLLALGRDVVEPVLAHERAHAHRRDLLWRALCPALAAGHLPPVTRAIRARLATAQEMAADACAADEMRDRVKIAETLLALARLGIRPAPGLSFTHGDVEARVRALLAPRSYDSRWTPRWLLGGCLAVVIAAGLAHDSIHHALETLLGALG